MKRIKIINIFICILLGIHSCQANNLTNRQILADVDTLLDAHNINSAKQWNRTKTDGLCSNSLRTEDISKRKDIVTTLLQQEQQIGNYKSVAHLATRLVVLKDSLMKQRMQEQTVEMQLEFDKRIKKEKQKNQNLYYFCFICILLFVALSIRFKRIRDKKKLLEEENSILEKEKINIYEQLEKNYSKTIDRLNRRLKLLHTYKESYKNKGHLLYEIATKGENIREWTKHDFIDFLDYYISIDVEYSLKLDETETLTPREKVFLVLIRQGKTEAKVADMMGMSNNALRTIKSRIKNKTNNI